MKRFSRASARQLRGGEKAGRFPDRPFVLVSLSTMFQGQEKTLRNICAAMAPLEVLVTGEALASPGRSDYEIGPSSPRYLDPPTLLACAEWVIE